MDINIIFQLAILIVSVMAHEVAHGATAYLFGDPTAKNQGRLTLNPIKHIDLFGSIILPLVLVISGSSFILGWAKPVPYNPYNLRNRRWGEFCVSIAGIIVNLLIALFFALILNFHQNLGLSAPAQYLIKYIIFLNLVLMVFNLVPIPPLDGSKILIAFLPDRYERFVISMERYGLFVLIVFIVFFGWIVSDIVSWLFNLFV
ncbi:MAG: site-2 protease family protein [Candidatus Paceibacterota bacterium]